MGDVDFTDRFLRTCRRGEVIFEEGSVGQHLFVVREGDAVSFLKRWSPALAMMAAIFFASSQTGTDLPRFEGWWDLLVKKGGHFLGYGMLGAAYLHGLAHGRRVTVPRVVLAIALAALYAASDELHQSFVPGRSPSPVDVLIDSAGACAGTLFLAFRSGGRPGAGREGAPSVVEPRARDPRR
jgi:VanZ family protein